VERRAKKQPAGTGKPRAGGNANREVYSTATDKCQGQRSLDPKDALKGRWVPVSVSFLATPELKPSEKVVWIALASHQFQEKQAVFPSLSRLAELTGLSRRTVKRAVVALRKHGFLKVKNRPGTTSVYELRYGSKGKANPEQDDNKDKTGDKMTPPGGESTGGEKSQAKQADGNTGDKMTPVGDDRGQNDPGWGQNGPGGGDNLSPPPAQGKPDPNRENGRNFATEEKEVEEEEQRKRKAGAADAALVSQSQKSETPPTNGNGQDLEEIAADLLAELNYHAGRDWPENPVTLAPIIARLREGYTYHQLRGAILHCVGLWKGTPYETNLRPKVICGPKLPEYVGESERIALLSALEEEAGAEMYQLQETGLRRKEEGASEDELQELRAAYLEARERWSQRHEEFWRYLETHYPRAFANRKSVDSDWPWS